MVKIFKDKKIYTKWKVNFIDYGSAGLKNRIGKVCKTIKSDLDFIY